MMMPGNIIGTFFFHFAHIPEAVQYAKLRCTLKLGGPTTRFEKRALPDGISARCDLAFPAKPLSFAETRGALLLR